MEGNWNRPYSIGMEAKNSRTWENGKLVQKSSHTLWLTTCLFWRDKKIRNLIIMKLLFLWWPHLLKDGGLTLTEAQQYGCVPLAFHSFASLTDIITDKVNGFAIPNDDISLYIKQMKLLMTDEKLRKSMSANAIESSKSIFQSKLS